MPARRSLHIDPDVERHAGPRAEDRAAGDAERERDLLAVEPDHHCSGRDSDEHRPTDAADDAEDRELDIAVRQAGHDPGQTLHQQPEHERLLHAELRGEDPTGDVREPVPDDVGRDEEAQRAEPDLELRADLRKCRGDVEPVERQRADAEAEDGEHAPARSVLRAHRGSRPCCPLARSASSFAARSGQDDDRATLARRNS